MKLHKYTIVQKMILHNLLQGLISMKGRRMDIIQTSHLVYILISCLCVVMILSLKIKSL